MENNVSRCTWLPTLILTNALVFSLCDIPAILTDPIPHTFWANFFYYASLITQNFLYSCLLALIILPIFLWIKNDKTKLALAWLPVSVALVTNYMNAKIFAFWRVYVNSDILSLYFSPGGGSQVFEVNNDMYLWISVVVLIALISGFLILLLSRYLHSFFRPKRWLCFFTGCYLVLQGVFIYLCMTNNMTVIQYTLKIPYFYDLSLANFFEKMGLSIFPKNSLTRELQMILRNTQKMHYPLQPLQFHPPKKPLNVLLIVVDTLRYDMINPINMPNVYAFSKHASQFLDNLSGGDCTQPGIFSLFYGIPATYWQPAFVHRQPSIIMQAFQKAHYQFGLFASAPLSSPPFEKTVFADIKNLRIKTPGDSPIQREIKITDEMQNFLKKEAKTQHPFFGFVFYDGPHAYNALPLYKPFHPTRSLNYFYIHRDTQRTPIFNLYKNAVFFDDGLIAKLFATLKKNNLYRNTVVIVTADHGQEFDDDHNDYWEHASGFSKYQVRTPMIIAWPDRKPALYHYQTTHFDLAPTLLKNVLGVTNPESDYSVGDDLFSKKQPRAVIVGNYVYYALILDGKIMQFHNSGLYQFTNLTMTPIPEAKVTALQRKKLLQEMTGF